MDRTRVAKVFVPGTVPEYTYNPRTELNLEADLEDYLDSGGAILTVAGPTKSGKTVLVRRVVKDPVWVDGQGLDNVDTMWQRAGDALAVYTDVESTTGQSVTTAANAEASAGLPFFQVKGGGQYGVSDTDGLRTAVNRPISSVVKQALTSTLRPLVIDDFHFVERTIQREIVRALKPLVLHAVPIILVSISHRAQDVVQAEPDMAGRVTPLEVNLWSRDELGIIASKGFAALGLSDPGNQITPRLTENSFGSPHLMQKFCREVCKEAGIRDQQVPPVTLTPPADWAAFFRKQVDPSSANWFSRLLRGPDERGSVRTRWQVEARETLDGYGIMLAAIARTGPKLTLTKDEIKSAVDAVVHGSGPATNQTTRVLQQMTKIAATSLTQPIPTLDQLAKLDPDNVRDVQPVLEYVDSGPTSTLHIADPFFAFYLRWAAESHLKTSSKPQSLQGMLPIDYR